jgi:AcrR family transcriptional regulator
MSASRITERRHARKGRYEGRRVRVAGASEARRARIVEATADVVAKHGVAGASVESVCARAQVSRRTFYTCFADLDECVVAVMRVSSERVAAVASRALEGQERWFDGVRAALAAVLAFFDREPVLARVCVVESLGGSTVIREQREEFVRAFRELIMERIDREDPGFSPVIADGVMASVLGAIYAHIVMGEPGPLIELHSRSMGLIAALNAGADELEREIARNAALTQVVQRGPTDPVSPQPRIPAVLADPRAHRARECLIYLQAQGRRGSYPSNREVGLGAGVANAAQVSVLLARLAGLGLVSKDCGGPGHPNAWRLTEQGELVARALGAQSARHVLRNI